MKTSDIVVSVGLLVLALVGWFFLHSLALTVIAAVLLILFLIRSDESRFSIGWIAALALVALVAAVVIPRWDVYAAGALNILQPGTDVREAGFDLGLSSSDAELGEAAADAGLDLETVGDIAERAAVELCNETLFGDALYDPTATELRMNFVGGYNFGVFSHDEAIINGFATTKGGATITENESLVIETDLTSVGVGDGGTDDGRLDWNNENDRWNISGCLIPDGTDPWKYLADLQIGKEAYGLSDAGEAKPRGFYFHNVGDPEILWTNVPQSEEVLAQYQVQ